MVYRCLKKLFDGVIKVQNHELTKQEKQQLHASAECNPILKKASHCYLCEFPLECKKLCNATLPTRDCTRLDFVVRKEYQFLKNTFSRDEIRKTKYLCSLQAYYNALDFLFKSYQFISRLSDYLVHFDQSTLNEEYKIFVAKFMPECKTVERLHKQIKELKVPRNLGNVTTKQRPFALMYTMYTFAEMTAKKNMFLLLFLVALVIIPSIHVK